MPNAFTKQAAASAAVSASSAPAIGKHHARQALCAAESGQQRLVGEPLADEAVERRQAGDRDRADQEAERRRQACGGSARPSPPCCACRWRAAPSRRPGTAGT